MNGEKVSCSLKKGQESKNCAWIGGRSLAFQQGTRLVVEPGESRITSPSVFVLKSQKETPIVACLAKDFYPKYLEIYMNSTKNSLGPDKVPTKLSPQGKYSAALVANLGTNDAHCQAKHQEKWVTNTETASKLKGLKNQNKERGGSDSEKCQQTSGTSRTIPSVYRLEADKPNEDLPNTVCLVTDFPKPDTTLTVDEKEIRLNETSVLDKSISDVWRYSAVIWDNDNPSKDLACNVKYDGKDVPRENLIGDAPTTCETRMISENFKTDMSLNGLSFSVLGLRLLVIKGLIFNLISSAKLWSI
ncbi:uncharacterized protein [Ranitomeya imitator]|uniref:uncharacterized protein n=1 Tax=Ranitomeya imitator TaxID=111125 RepID=UPI0037E95BDF